MHKKLLASLPVILLLTGCHTNNPISSTSDSTSISLSESSSISSVEESSSSSFEFIEQSVTIIKESADIVPTTIQEAVEKVYDSVVVINSYSMSSVGAGAGVIFAANDTYSYIITCHHVIENATSFKVTLSDENTYNASLIGGDDETDIAILAIEKTGLTISHFTDDSDKIGVGSTAIAIGNPLGTLANTVTVGVVSAVSRNITTNDGTTRKLIQTDAAINSGNSGGGLFNAAGELIGIVSSKYSSSSIEGLAFAVPSNIACDIASQLLEKGYIEGRYKLGILIKDGYIGGFFGRQQLVPYIYSVDKDGSASELLYRDDILKSIKVDYRDPSKEDIMLEEIEEANDANAFIENANISIGDKLIFEVYRGAIKDSNLIEVEIEIKQYIYSID